LEQLGSGSQSQPKSLAAFAIVTRPKTGKHWPRERNQEAVIRNNRYKARELYYGLQLKSIVIFAYAFA
jgi:hypothetical protein